MYQLIDFQTKKPVSTDSFIYTGENGPWEVQMDLDYVRSRINPDYFRKSPPFASKYLPFMPVRDFSGFVSLGEGATPLIRSRNIGRKLGIELYFKVEGKNPTGSFKDRGSAVEMTLARELGVKGLSVASTGNMAASCSCYAAAAGIPCFVFVPEDTPTSKLSQSISYGGKIVQVKGGYNDAARLAEAVAREHNFYLAGDYAFRVEGQKTAAFELMDQLFFQVPDMVVVPIGCGTNVTAYGKGFREYRELGFISRIPKIIGVQAEGANTVVQAFQKGVREITALEKTNTICSAISVTYPLDGVKAIDAIYTSGGEALQVNDREALECQYMLAREEGLFVEASCATALAALVKLSKREEMLGQKVVIVLTGDGLKDPSPLLKVAIKPPTIYPEVEDFNKLYRRSFFDGKNVAFVEPDEVLLTTVPEKEELSMLLRKHLGASLADAYLELMQEAIAKFLKKGKQVTFSDLQDIVQDVLETAAKKGKGSFAVVDYQVKISRKDRAEARVVVLKDGVEHTSDAAGVGPFDAIIKALQAAGADKNFTLSGYKVDIRGGGTDAVVYVELKLVREGFVSVGRGTSPDIIQASVEAFEDAYNSF